MFSHPALISAAAQEHVRDMMRTAEGYRLAARGRAAGRHRRPAARRTADTSDEPASPGRLVVCELTGQAR